MFERMSTQLQSLHCRPFRGRDFSGNRSHWYWQQNSLWTQNPGRRECSGGSSLEFFWRGGGHGPMASAVREPITGVWGEAPLKLKHFCFWTFTGSRKFVHFSKICKRKKNHRYLCCLSRNEV